MVQLVERKSAFALKGGEADVCNVRGTGVVDRPINVGLSCKSTIRGLVGEVQLDFRAQKYNPTHAARNSPVQNDSICRLAHVYLEAVFSIGFSPIWTRHSVNVLHALAKNSCRTKSTIAAFTPI